MYCLGLGGAVKTPVGHGAGLSGPRRASHPLGSLWGGRLMAALLLQPKNCPLRAMPLLAASRRGGLFSPLSSQNPSARMAPCSHPRPQGVPAPRPQGVPAPRPQGVPAPHPQGVLAPCPQGVLVVHSMLWWARCFVCPDAQSILGAPCAALVAQGTPSICAWGAAGALNKRLFSSIPVLTPFSLSPLARPRASVCVSVSDPQQADALPPSEGAPLVRRGHAAQMGLLFPAAESCQAWLPSQKAALLQNISSYCLSRCELCWSREGERG